MDADSPTAASSKSRRSIARCARDEAHSAGTMGRSGAHRQHADIDRSGVELWMARSPSRRQLRRYIAFAARSNTSSTPPRFVYTRPSAPTRAAARALTLLRRTRGASRAARTFVPLPRPPPTALDTDFRRDPDHSGHHRQFGQVLRLARPCSTANHLQRSSIRRFPNAPARLRCSITTVTLKRR